MKDKYKDYELKDHLGNVVITFTDLKLPDLYSYFKLDYRTFSYYYPFGMEVPQTHWTSAVAGKE